MNQNWFKIGTSMRKPSGFDFMIAKWQRQREGNSVFDNQERNKLIYRGMGVALTAVVFMMAVILAIALKKRDDTQETVVLTIQEETHKTIVFGAEQRTTKNSWGEVTAYSERESFTHYLINNSQEQDYVMAEITVGEDKADFDWTFGEGSSPKSREDIVAQYLYEKEHFALQENTNPADYWLFLKIKTKGIYDLDIWHGVQEAWGGNLEKYHDISAFVNETGRVCSLREYNNGTALGKWIVYIKDDFLYVLECLENQISDSKELKLPIRYFYYTSILEGSLDECTWGMDDELFYWRDHDKRVTTLENPHRIYTQTVGTDDRWSHFPGKMPCGILEKAEYIVSLSEESPEIRICFTLKSNAADCYLPDIGAADYLYAMEVSEAESGKVLQNGEVLMCVDAVDTLRFEDLDKDGFLDMHIVYPDHAVVSESNAEDQFSYTYYWYDPPSYWIWNSSEKIFEHMSKRDLSKRLNENLTGQQEAGSMGVKDIVVVQEGDSLWGIAEKYLGDGRKYRIIYDRNRAVIGDNPDLILPGTELVLEIVDDR